MTEWSKVRSCILEEEKRIRNDHNLEIRVYGTGSQGYRLLRDCLYQEYYQMGRYTAEEIWNGNTQRSKILRKQIHEYWTFLCIVRALMTNLKLKEPKTVFYQPCRSKVQKSAVTTPNGDIFVEPALLPYDRDEILEEYGDIPYLKKYETRINIVPDFVILKRDKIPWAAHKGIKWIYEISKEAKEAYIKFSKMWKELAKDALIIECKEEKLAKGDITQILWYRFGYDCKVLLIAQEKVKNEEKELLNQCGIDVIEDFRICDSEKCFNALASYMGMN